jgi:polysaccharide deacetylase family protein (PEP-CTERM system associated)
MRINEKRVPRHALTFDVEEHFQVSAFWTLERRGQWDKLESRVERNTLKIANILASRSTRATFFVLGWVAERHPALVKELALYGHEIASHGYGHELVSDQTPEEFREDIRRAKGILEDLIGKKVAGYRAPSFSITSETEWAIEILVEEGFQYDSSIYDRFRSKSASNVGKPSKCYHISTSSGVLLEVSPSTITTLGVQLPVGGGGYFRLLPYGATRMLLKRLENQGSQLVIYLHPWELDPAQPRMNGALLSKARHYLNLDKTEQGLRRLLDDFVFGPIDEMVRPEYWQQGKNQDLLTTVQKASNKTEMLFTS